MPWLRESDVTHTTDEVLHGKTFENIQLLLENDIRFMYPEGYEKMSKEEKYETRKKVLLMIARNEFCSAITSAMELIEKYAEDLINITAPREKVVDGEVKTLQGWNDSDINSFDEYVKENEKVDYDIVMHFADCVLPRTYNSGMVQCGEPYDHVTEGARYATFIFLYKDDNYGGQVWQYKGHCLAGSCDKGTAIPEVSGV